jgi:hypothetical protein
MPITAEARPSTATTTTVRPAVISSRLFANPLGLILAPFRGGAFIHWAHGGCLGGCGQTEGVIKPVAKRPDEFEDASSEFNLGVQIVSMEGPAARAIPWVARALTGASPRRATCRRPAQ